MGPCMLDPTARPRQAGGWEWGEGEVKGREDDAVRIVLKIFYEMNFDRTTKISVNFQKLPFITSYIY